MAVWPGAAGFGPGPAGPVARVSAAFSSRMSSAGDRVRSRSCLARSISRSTTFSVPQTTQTRSSSTCAGRSESGDMSGSTTTPRTKTRRFSVVPDHILDLECRFQGWVERVVHGHLAVIGDGAAGSCPRPSSCRARPARRGGPHPAGRPRSPVRQVPQVNLAVVQGDALLVAFGERGMHARLFWGHVNLQ